MNRDSTPRHARSWYGLPVEIVIEGDYWHWVKAGPVPLPHPPLVNLIVRHGLPREARLRLSYWHELGHVQTLPAALIHTLWMWRRVRRGQRDLPLWRRLARGLGVLVVHEALWEVLAELYVVLRAPRAYWRSYRSSTTRVPLLFWGALIGLALAGTLKIAGTGKSSPPALPPAS